MLPKDLDPNSFSILAMVQTSNLIKCCKIPSDENTILCSPIVGHNKTKTSQKLLRDLKT
jgi:hypothetical protein